MADAKPSIMLIDDEERVREQLAEYLDDLDLFAVRVAGTAEEALGSLRAQAASVCVVDMRLPGMNGVEFIHVAGETGLCGRFILHTGSVDFTLPERLQSLGVAPQDLFLKPCSLAALAARIQEHLDALGPGEG